MRSSPGHRTAAIQQNVDADALSRFAQLYKKLFVAAIGVPIHVAQVIAAGIGAMVAEIKGGPQVAAASLTQHGPPQRGHRAKAKSLQPAQKSLVKEGQGGFLRLRLKIFFIRINNHEWHELDELVEIFLKRDIR